VTLSPEQLLSAVDAELAALANDQISAHCRSLLVRPYAVMREWDYGEPGLMYPCWSVLEHEPSNTAICFCEQGFGPENPWGLVNLAGPANTSIGMDSGWFKTFLEAYLESGAASALPIWRVFKQEGDRFPGVPITPAGDWETTWKHVTQLRADDTVARYHCHHGLRMWWHEI
jgi:hypothetical protein